MVGRPRIMKKIDDFGFYVFEQCCLHLSTHLRCRLAGSHSGLTKGVTRQPFDIMSTTEPQRVGDVNSDSSGNESANNGTEAACSQCGIRRGSLRPCCAAVLERLVCRVVARSNFWDWDCSGPPPLRSGAAAPKVFGAGGAEGIRTPDLLIANETLYQLSYDPSLAVRTTVVLPQKCAPRNS